MSSTKYCRVQELRRQIEKSSRDGSASDDALKLVINSVEALIDTVCNRPDGFKAQSSATVRYFNGSGMPYQKIDECVEITEVAVKDSVSDSSYTAWDAPTTNMAGDGDWLAYRGGSRNPNFNPLGLQQPRPYDHLMIDVNGSYSVFTSGKYQSKGGFRPSTPINRGVPTVKVTAKYGFAVTPPSIVTQVCIIQSARWWKKGQFAHADQSANVELGQMTYQQPMDSDLLRLLSAARLIMPSAGGR